MFFSISIANAVTITVSPTSDPPVAVDDSVSTNEDTAVNIVVLSNDSDPDSDTLTTIDIVNVLPSHGVATLKADGTIDYTPNPNFSGQDSFVYSISDGKGETDTATGASRRINGFGMMSPQKNCQPSFKANANFLLCSYSQSHKSRYSNHQCECWWQ